MNPKLVNLFKLLFAAMVISATAGCATAQTVFVPGIVAEAKSAGNEAIAAESAALVPGSVDLSITRNDPRPAYSGALVSGSVDLSISNDHAALTVSGALVPGSIDLSISKTGSQTVHNGALVLGSVDLSRAPAAVGPAMPYLSRLRR